MRAHVRFALYRDVLQVLAQLDDPCSGKHEKEAAGTASELTAVLAALATLTPPGSQRRADLLQRLEVVLEGFGVLAPYNEADGVGEA
jgi:hypothetical protein